MPEIVTITFNPCIDKSTTVAAFIPEKKLRCTDPKFEPGGGGINVSRAIKKLGGQSIAIYPAGGYSGKFLKTLLDGEGIDSIMIETGSHTRENLIVVDKSTNSQYRFGMPGSKLIEKEWKNCLIEIEKIKGIEFIVVSGSLPPGVPPGVLRELVKLSKKLNAKFIADTSGEALQQAVNEGVFLLKPNLNELSALLGKKELKKEEILMNARQLISRGGAEILVISLGAQGALLVTVNDNIQFIPPPVERKSTVGAGDSMVAGIVLRLALGNTISDAVQYGVACGTAATMNPGTELCNREDVEAILPIIAMEDRR